MPSWACVCVASTRAWEASQGPHSDFNVTSPALGSVTQLNTEITKTWKNTNWMKLYCFMLVLAGYKQRDRVPRLGFRGQRNNVYRSRWKVRAFCFTVFGFLLMPCQCLRALGFAFGTEVCACVLVASMLGWQNMKEALNQSSSGMLCLWRLRESLGKTP